MKVKEIAEALEVNVDEIIMKLSNVGIEADAETVVREDIIKKLSRAYKRPIRPVKKSATPPKKEEDKPEVKIEEKVEIKVKEKPKPVIEIKQEEIKTQPKQEQPKSEEDILVEQVVKEIEELELSRDYAGKYSDYEDDDKQFRRQIKRPKGKNIKDRKTNIPSSQTQITEKVLYYIDGMTVANIADGLGVPVSEIVRKLITLGYMVSATQAIEREIVELLAEDFGFILKDKEETDVTKFEDLVIVDDEEDLQERPPIVTIMGHVDHGKTTLLDTIRHTNVAAREAGGITQHIGAYQVQKNGKLITFIDTPGHAAFTEMRARGAEVTDIVILVVAADDGVMPQTREAVEHAQAAKVPIIVAINKIDKSSADPERIKADLSKLDLIPEEWGGNTIYVPISALTGKGVDDLLEMVLLQAEMMELKANPNRLGLGSVIEARLDRGRGPVATLLVRNGSIKIGDPIVVGTTWGKIRAMFDEYNKAVKVAGPSKPVESIGLEEVPFAGDPFMVFEDERTARMVAEERKLRALEREKGVGKKISLADLFAEAGNTTKELNLIVKADVQGSIEVIKGSLEKLNVEGVKINVIRGSVGTITETDVTLAQASDAIIIGFNVRPTAKVSDFAKERNVEIRLYNVIYRIFEDIEDAMKGMLEPVYEEQVLGQAEVRQTFKASKIGTIAGCYVTNGVIVRGEKARIIRDGIVVYEGEIASLRRHKDDVREVRQGFECGLTIQNYNDIKEDDIIEVYTMVKVQR
ncbi:MAG: translation initiation factor IF-2 [Acholeplasmataceae bacterium]|nr:translation initiation factor IF-2 [Acholeplasmataceae bacterium]